MASLSHLVGVVFWVAVLMLGVGLARRAALWRNGRAAAVNWLGLFAIPKRYFVDLHHVVAREPFVANAHVAVAGGAVLALLVVGINYGLALYRGWLDGVLLLAGAVMLGGARRWPGADAPALPRSASRVGRGAGYRSRCWASQWRSSASARWR